MRILFSSQTRVSCQAQLVRFTVAELAWFAMLDGACGSDRILPVVDGESENDTGVFLFADPELTSFDVFGEIWGGRAAWPESLLKVRDQIEEQTGIRFPVARSVYYQDGSNGIGFHYDPPAYGPTDEIASISLGAERDFVLRSTDNPEDRHTLKLAHGSLLFMGEGCQERYEHAVPASPECKQPRLNLTFRKFGFG